MYVNNIILWDKVTPTRHHITVFPQPWCIPVNCPWGVFWWFPRSSLFQHLNCKQPGVTVTGTPAACSMRVSYFPLPRRTYQPRPISVFIRPEALSASCPLRRMRAFNASTVKTRRFCATTSARLPCIRARGTPTLGGLRGCLQIHHTADA